MLLHLQLWLLLLVGGISLATLPAPAAGLSPDGTALLAFAGGITSDPAGALASWNPADASPCAWGGVQCGAGGRVVALNLGFADLGGTLRGAGAGGLANLTALQVLNLTTNNLQGAVPPELGECAQLDTLDLGSNAFQGRLVCGCCNCTIACLVA